MRYVDLMRLNKSLFRAFWNLLLIIFGGKKWRSYVLNVPYYCRYKCDYLGACRNPEKQWKCRNGCMRINEAKYYQNLTFDEN